MTIEALNWLLLFRALLDLLAFAACILVVWYMHNRARRMTSVAAVRFARFMQLSFALAMPWCLIASYVQVFNLTGGTGPLTPAQFTNSLWLSVTDVLRALGKIALAAHLMGFLFPTEEEEANGV